MPLSANLLVTEASLALLEQIRQSVPEISLEGISGCLDLREISNKEAVQALWVTVRSSVGRDEIDALPNLRLIVTASAGYDHIDVQAARERGITVCNVPEYGPAVAEFNIALMLALARKLHLGYLQTLQKEFSLSGLLGTNLQGKTLGVVGAGNIGLRVLELAKAFGMRLLATDPSPDSHAADRIGFEYTSLDRLLRQTDVIALCCPLNSATHHLIGRKEFEAMRRGVLLVNTSRGAVVDTQALLWALNQGIVNGAALDVLEAETLLTHEQLLDTLEADAPADTVQSIAEDLALMRHPKVLVTPHMAYYSQDSLDAITHQTVRNVTAFFRGSPENVVS